MNISACARAGVASPTRIPAPLVIASVAHDVEYAQPPEEASI